MDNTLTLIVIVGGVLFIGLLILGFALGLFVHAVAVAVSLLAWAAEWGFVGVVLYVIVWVVATPVMIAICVIGGVIRWLCAEHQEEKAESLPPRRVMDPEEYAKLYDEPLSPYEREQIERERRRR